MSLNFSKDKAQSCLYVGDNSNMTIYLLNRANLQELGSVGPFGVRNAGQFHWLHQGESLDSHGNIYTCGVKSIPQKAHPEILVRYGAAGLHGHRLDDGRQRRGAVMTCDDKIPAACGRRGFVICITAVTSSDSDPAVPSKVMVVVTFQWLMQAPHRRRSGRRMDPPITAVIGSKAGHQTERNNRSK